MQQSDFSDCCVSFMTFLKSGRPQYRPACTDQKLRATPIETTLAETL